jgi:hypothetical protein
VIIVVTLVIIGVIIVIIIGVVLIVMVVTPHADIGLEIGRLRRAIIRSLRLLVKVKMAALVS